MTYAELMQTITEASEEDWLDNDAKGIFTFKPDLDIRIVRRRDDDYEMKVVPEWATHNPHSGAGVMNFDIYYRSTFVKSFQLAHVDEFRAWLPIPYPGTNEASPEDYRLAVQLDTQNTLESYTHMSGLTVKK